ncbi:FAD-binding and (Fe-S)-binding domain-containing protein [Marinilabilia salmonicolor]|uniref:FAD-binding and (Fe-S)-binding domain-containing protein n=2 Tax=Marinilabilia salmonicolor TaxID=989 RepID=UPI00029B46EE|nr:FAD-binding and (Fe-S)-binding domain-containing protein [Marinilabilia salmonicolor]
MGNNKTTLQRFRQQLNGILPASRVYTDALYTLTKGTDAGFYRLIPDMVIKVESEYEMVGVLQLCSLYNIPVTFKSGGTSLSGQTITNSVLIDTGDGFSDFKISPDGKYASFQSGISGGLANARLAPYGHKLGPSPASINSARIGGIVSNNASGASYGIRYNSYNTVESMRMVLADGTVLDTGDLESRRCFEETHSDMLSQLTALSKSAKSNEAVRQKIQHKFELKNTCGYGVNSLIDFEDPIDVLQHLMVGSEGTLGFISEVSFKTVREYGLKATSMVFFKNIKSACEAILPLRGCSVSAAELMDRNALRSVENKSGMPPVLKTLDEEVVALLVETSAEEEDLLNIRMKEIEKALSFFDTVYPVEFTTDKDEYNRLWKVRKGLFTSAAASRPKGTACIIEDLAFRADVLGDALVDLKKLIEEFGYEGYVIWGHLLDGNIHFVMMPDFNNRSGVERYRQFMEALVKLVVHKYDGSLKAEHGTGRNMAPFVREEWGEDIYDLMKKIKEVVDPRGILNPGVIINDDPEIHLKNLKPLPVAHDLIDNCIECGFCEINCPSRGITLTPRQRIVAYREMHRLSLEGKDKDRLSELKKRYNYDGDATCATDGLCELACPVDINTGKLIKDLRFDGNSSTGNKVASWIANHMSSVTLSGRFVLGVVGGAHRVLGTKVMSGVSSFLFKVSGHRIPLWNPHMPHGGPSFSVYESNGHDLTEDTVVYFPTCINRTMGKSVDYGKEMTVVEKTRQLLEKAGFNVVFPEGLKNLCCGMAFDSKGFKEQGLRKARELDQALLKASQNGKYPVYCDMSPCLLRMKETLSSELDLYEPVEFILKYFPDRLHFKKLNKKIAIHTTCSSTKMGLESKLLQVAQMCAEEVIVPDEVGCCGWAGDRGFTHPELNASALKPLRRQLPDDVECGYSTSRTCEIGLSLHSGISYKSIVYLVDEATQIYKKGFLD